MTNSVRNQFLDLWSGGVKNDYTYSNLYIPEETALLVFIKSSAILSKTLSINKKKKYQVSGSKR